MKKHAWLAAFLNIVFPGIGYLYAGKRWFLGLAMAIFWGLVYAGMFVSPEMAQGESGPLDVYVGLAYFLLVIGFAFDVYEEVKSTPQV